MTQPFVMPEAIRPFATATPYIPTENGEYFYRLSPKAVVVNNVSAFVNIVVLDENNAPEIGVQVVNVRPDGKGEISSTKGNGDVQFNFGPGSAFSNPGQGPYSVFMALGATRPEDPPFFVDWKKILGDRISSLGDWQGNHTEIYLQFRKIMASSKTNPTSLADAIRYPAYEKIGNGAYNPEAALQNQARKKKLKAVLTDEFEVLYQNILYVCQGFTESIIYTIKGQYADSDFKLLEW